MNKLKYLVLITLSSLIFFACPSEKSPTIIKQEVGYAVINDIDISSFKFEIENKYFNNCDELELRLYSIEETTEPSKIKGKPGPNYSNFTLILEKVISNPNDLFFYNNSLKNKKEIISRNQNYIWEISCKNKFTETKKVSTFTTAKQLTGRFRDLNQIIKQGYVSPTPSKIKIDSVRIKTFNIMPARLCTHTMSGGGMQMGGEDVVEISFLEEERIREVDLTAFTFGEQLNMEFWNTIKINHPVAVNSTLSSPSFSNRLGLITNHLPSFLLFDDGWDNPIGNPANNTIQISNNDYLPSGTVYPKTCHFKVNMNFSYPYPNSELNVISFLDENNGHSYSCTSSPTLAQIPYGNNYQYYSCCGNSTGHISNHVLITNFAF